MLFTFTKSLGDLKLVGINESTAPNTMVRVSWGGEFQEAIRVATNDPKEAVGIVEEQLLVEAL